MLNQRQLKIFVVSLFSLIIILLFISKMRESNIHDEILQADISQIENVRFYRDFLRNEGGGLNLAITEEADLKELLRLLQEMKSSNHSLKSLTTVALYRIQLNLKVNENRLLTFNIYRSEETGDLGVISLDQGENLIVPGGQFESEELLRWVENMKKREVFKDIGGDY